MRAIAYIRVSKERDEGVSPDIQLAAISAYCQERGHTIVANLQDLDLTGTMWKRRKIEQAVTMIEAGEADLIVVWKISRVARNRLDWNIAVDRVESVGGTLESATERLDTTTSTGRFTRGMLAELAAFESERIGEGWREAIGQRYARGLPASGRPRWGYRYDGTYQPDPVTGPLVRSVYERYVAGESARSLAFWLNRHGHPTVAGGDWTGGHLIRNLDRGFGAGLLRTKTGFLPGAHPPVIDAALWEAYRGRRVRSAQEPPRIRAPKFALSGLLRCAGCGSSMMARQRKPHPPGTLWICTGHSQKQTCPVGGVEAFAPRILKELRTWVLTNSEVRNTPAIIVPPKTRVDPTVRLRKTVAQSEAKLLDLARKNLDGFYDDPTYLMLRDQVTVARDEAAKELAQYRPHPSAAVFLTVAEAWDEMEPWEMREALRLLLHHVLVVKGEGTPRAARRCTYIPVPLWTV